jgi:hypothetical protein
MQDLFEQIKEVEKQNLSFYDDLPDEHKNSVSHFMLFKWMSYTSDAKQVLHMNALVNTKLFSLSKHKGLLYKLLIAASHGKHHYKWLKRDLKKNSLVLRMISDAHNVGQREAEEILDLYSKEELLELCGEMNYDKTDADKVKKEINVLRV